jgi:hypothetical protein
LLYPNWNFNETPFDQDHIFPSENFDKKSLLELGLNFDEIEEWQEMKDQVPNLQILASRANRVKNDSDFLEWINSKNEKFKNDFIKQNYIPEDVSYELKDFKKFFEARKEILKEKLTLALEIT